MAVVEVPLTLHRLTPSGRIHGIGIDVVDVVEVSRSIARFGDVYLRRLLSPAEVDLYVQRSTSSAALANTVARTFAIKECLTKVLGPADVPWPWRNLEVVLPRDAADSCIRLTGEPARLAYDAGLTLVCVEWVEHATTLIATAIALSPLGPPHAAVLREGGLTTSNPISVDGEPMEFTD